MASLQAGTQTRISSKSEPRAKSQTPKTPKNWPDRIAYLTSLTHSPNLDPTPLRRARSLIDPSSTTPILTKSALKPSPLVSIQLVPPSHPSYPQDGLFAAQHMEPSTLIVPYLGLVHGAQDTDETSDYDISLDRELEVSIDAAKAGNEARFVNDYRGVAEGPNAEFGEVWIELGRVGGDIICERAMGVFVLSTGKAGGKRARGIRKGEEILVSYGKGFWRERERNVGGE